MSNSTLIKQTKSKFNEESISVYYTSKSANAKTGNIPNTTILVDDVKPTDAIKNGQDFAICGDCQLRRVDKTDKLSCYVNCGFGPNAIHNAKNRGSIKDTLDINQIKVQRHCSYGDPASLSKELNYTILDLADKTLCYTHQWEKPEFNYLKSFCMASVHSKSEAKRAQKLGFRTFRILENENVKLMDNEKMCFYYSHNVQCVKCQQCDGQQSNLAFSIAIPKH